MRKYLFVLKLLSILCPTEEFTDSTHPHLTLVPLWKCYVRMHRTDFCQATEFGHCTQNIDENCI